MPDSPVSSDVSDASDVPVAPVVSGAPVSSDLQLWLRGQLAVGEVSPPPQPARHGRLGKPRAWPLVLTVVGATLAVLLASASAVAAIAFNSVYSEKTTVQIFGQTEGPPPQIGAIAGGFNILIVGSDTRTGQGGIGGDPSDDSGVLNDVNILLHVSQDQTNAVAISFPRDMVVDIPECPYSDGSGTKGESTEPINVALSYGGLSCVVQTVQKLTGLPIQFAGMITFQGVIAMSDAIGGVDVCVTGPVVDSDTGINLPAAGSYKLQGFDALAFLRTRGGVGDGSDLTRISSQQVFLSSLVRSLKSSETLGDFKKVYSLADAAFSNMTLSTGLASIPTMTSIALALKEIPLKRVTFVQYPGFTGQTEGVYAGKVRPDTDLAEQLMAKVLSDTPFLLASAGDGRGSEADPNAPVASAPAPVETGSAAATAAPPVAPVDNTGLETISGLRGQTAADYTCSIAND